MACVNVVAADTVEEAAFISTSFLQLAVGIITGKRRPMQPPVKNMDDYWSEYEKAAVSQMMTYSFVGDAELIRVNMHDFIDETQTDEIMVVGHIFEHKARLRSFEIVSEVFGGIPN
jgi:alkanesulfonate monooxygenase SsuD/methylene tetrahydromethanopterin reductase-like flavin-dependent oxidoreductase (luciferase family)